MNAAPLLQPGRREHPRARVTATLVAFTQSRSLGPFLVEDLSVGGVRIAGESGLNRGQRVTLLFDLPGGAPVCCRADVVRIETKPGDQQVSALMFVDPCLATRTKVGNAVVRDLLTDWTTEPVSPAGPLRERRPPRRAAAAR